MSFNSLRFSTLGVIALLACLMTSAAQATEPAAAQLLLETEWSIVDIERPLPSALTVPGGKTRWELTELSTRPGMQRTIVELADGRLELLERGADGEQRTIYSAAARPWLLPHLSAAEWSELEFTATQAGTTEQIQLRRQRLATGWAFLPSSPYEVVLERIAESVRLRADGPAKLTRVGYRWVDPRVGVVAESWGSPAANGQSIVDLQQAQTLDNVLQGGLGLKIFASEIAATPFGRLALGYDRRGSCTVGGGSCTSNSDCVSGGGDKCTIPISGVTTVAHATMGDLIAATSWDFSPNQLANSRYEIGSTTTPINSAETCNFDKCGFATSTQMGREDKNFNDVANAFVTLSATESEQRPGDFTIWLRGAVRNEGTSTGGLGESESRTCNVGTDGGGRLRPDVPLWRFSNQDMPGAEFYMQSGDSWDHTPFNCEQSVFNHVCPNSCGLFCQIWVKGCSGLPGEGMQASEVIGEGVVTLPSGHTLNTLLVRQVVDFCVYLGSGCGLQVDSVHQVIYLWVAPNVGTVVRLMSEQNESSDSTFTDLMETDIKYGLLPPRSISSTGSDASTIDISWDPGTITGHIDGYKIYWDTDSGASTGYAFNSVDNAGQINVSGTTATISGLTAGTTYYITVTALSDYGDLATGVITTYESLLFPTATSGAGAPLPAELVEMTSGGSCTPTAEVTGLTISQVAGGIEACWDASSDPCVDGYSILGANSPEAAGNFSTVVADTGLTTCHTFNPTEGYFLVVGKGTGGTGPWGHYGM